MTGCLALMTMLTLLGAQVAALALWAAGVWRWSLWFIPAPILAAALMLVALSLLGTWRRRHADRLAFERALGSVKPFRFR